ncbi:hypothetical protein FPQ18DRAFT_53524 [Pyronema domesticum]|uniref:Uncharacterized protein n=1 Tax=Pyronema omphalodes (strain CBS 100304) TaxID=1076935 RepID=U4LPN7_PYROM|nr:hypothetical protein FPQ18DRAFT_53524 [Pyronema domesticum]CCX34131.1 Protein of unknown function [Pyronema omphalodes CBS 100304]
MRFTTRYLCLLLALSFFTITYGQLLDGLAGDGDGQVCKSDEQLCTAGKDEFCCPSDKDCGSKKGQCDDKPKPTSKPEPTKDDKKPEPTSTKEEPKPSPSAESKKEDPKPSPTPEPKKEEPATTLKTSSTLSPTPTPAAANPTPPPASPPPADTTASPSNTTPGVAAVPIPTSTRSPSPTQLADSSNATTGKSTAEKIKAFFTPNVIIIIASSVGGAVIIIGALCFCCYRKRKQGRMLLAAYENPDRDPYAPIVVGGKSYGGGKRPVSETREVDFSPSVPPNAHTAPLSDRSPQAQYYDLYSPDSPAFQMTPQQPMSPLDNGDAYNNYQPGPYGAAVGQAYGAASPGYKQYQRPQRHVQEPLPAAFVPTHTRQLTPTGPMSPVSPISPDSPPRPQRGPDVYVPEQLRGAQHNNHAI